ncbi:hypothetical protein B7P43_G10330 [Cryptotermes secundus]|uniref:Coiled-coil domain-containing protein R3HCC1L n=1 Tax=Cryptotermes secundus TaxID=105785 RepID=A0A2J7PZD5_9NEOP|nr:coiled-coil domain-containing protein R3HCC1L isoform X2 [Cryptotermes secundus]PNF21696.1 hypothetical protein B7P43_G10330 [Cryptotermes secundus]
MKAKTLPAVGIYRPPAARRSEEQIAPITAQRCSSPAAETKPERRRPARQRRPDIQVYVPRAKRLSTRGQDGDASSTASISFCQQVGSRTLSAHGDLCLKTSATSQSSEKERKSRMAAVHCSSVPTTLSVAHYGDNMSLRQDFEQTHMEVSDWAKNTGQSSELNCFVSDLNSDMNDREVDMDVWGVRAQHLSSEDVQSVYRKNGGKHMRVMENSQVQIEDEVVGRKFIRRDSNSSALELSDSNTPGSVHTEDQVFDDHSNIKNVDRILKTVQLHQGKDIYSSIHSSSNCQESNLQSVSKEEESDIEQLIDSEDLRSGDLTDDFLGEVGVQSGSVRRNSESSSPGHSSRDSPSSEIDNETHSSNYYCEIKNTTNRFQSKVLSCELNIQNPSEGNISQDSGFGNKSPDVSLNLEESDSVMKTSDDSGEFLKCSDTLGEKMIFNSNDSFHGNKNLSSVDGKKHFDDSEERLCTRKDLVSNDCHKKDENEEYRVQEKPNRKNRRIISGNVISDVLIISDPDPVADITPTSQIGSSSENSLSPNGIVNKKKKVRQKGVVTVEKSGPSLREHSADKQKSCPSPVKLNPEECTWDMMFDDNGECLDPKLMEELTNSVGSVTIEKPPSDYRSYQSRVELIMSGAADDEFSHVLEIYSFPAEFKTHDLYAVFSPYMKGGFEIKWVDDTHALGVFSSALVAAEVLATDHPFVKTRPLHEATPESRMKARRSAEFLQPYRARPETCAALARRLVTGALGVRLNTTREEREAERKLLREAREKKKLAARQRDQAWEGTLGEK